MLRLHIIPVVCFVLGAQDLPYQPRLDLDQGRFLKVLAEADARLSARENDAIAWAAKSQALSAFMQFSEAEAAAQKALGLRPGLPDALVARAMSRAGVALQQRSLSSLGRVSQAMDDLKTAVKNDPDYPFAWMTLGLAYQQLPGILGGSTRRALECANQLKRLQPARGNTLHAQILSMDGKWREAEPLFMQALATAPDDPEVVARYLGELGGRRTRSALGEDNQKQRLAREAARLLPSVRSRAKGVMAVSHALMESGRHEESWKVALDALPNVDSPSIIKLQLGKVAARTGLNRAEGLAFLDQAANEPIEGGTGGYATVHWRRGQILKDLGRLPEARDAASKALSYDSRHRGALELLEGLK